MTELPDYMPIVSRRMAECDYLPHYQEREITGPMDLCDQKGRLNPDAVGWSRSPLIRANLAGHWPRKKKWNMWNWISPDFVFSATLRANGIKLVKQVYAWFFLDNVEYLTQFDACLTHEFGHKLVHKDRM